MCTAASWPASTLTRTSTSQQFSTVPAGYWAWLRSQRTKPATKTSTPGCDEHGKLTGIGVEGCGSYGAGLARHLRSRGIDVVEVCRPNRQLRRRRGKSDAVDAEAAARTVLAGTDLVTPKTADGPVESMRALRLARRSALRARDQITNQLHALVVTSPTELRARLAGLPNVQARPRSAQRRTNWVHDPAGVRVGDGEPGAPLGAPGRRSRPSRSPSSTWSFELLLPKASSSSEASVQMLPQR